MLARSEDWNDLGAGKLWLYNAHYFDDLNATGRDSRARVHHQLLARWIAENPPGAGVGWEPYPLSRRIVNWIKWACAGATIPEAAVQSLAIQSRYLARCIEYHLLGNHLFANAKALVFAGSFFEGDEADRWLHSGLRILERELDEQVLADGGHFERSPMYHSIILEDLLDLFAASRVFPSLISPGIVDSWALTAGKMLVWLMAMSHPDGDIAFFNDAAFGIALKPAELGACARTLGLDAPAAPDEDLLRLEPSGYVRMRRGPLSVIFDAAPMGPDYLPGHGHADTLSFEFSWDAQRVLANSGSSTYGIGSQRAWERSTAAHNTVEVDAQDSSEVWSSFRVARRARPFGQDSGELGDMLYASGSHDGYRRLHGSPVHRRRIETRERSLRVNDTVSGSGVHQAIGYFHFHPDVRLEEGSEGGWKASLPQGTTLRIVGQAGLRLEREEGKFAPEFGKVIPRPVLVWRIQRNLPITAEIEIFEQQ